MNKNKILSGGGGNLTGGGKWGWVGEGIGVKGEGSGVKGGGKWGLGTPLSTPSTSGLSILWHGAISLPDAKSYDTFN